MNFLFYSQILKICTSRLGLPGAARRLFTTSGDEVIFPHSSSYAWYDHLQLIPINFISKIENVSELVKGEIYCVSCGENFIQPMGECLSLGYLTIIP